MQIILLFVLLLSTINELGREFLKVIDILMNNAKMFKYEQLSRLEFVEIS